MDDLFEVVINGDEVEAMESDDDEFTVVAVAEEEMGDRLEAGTLEQAVLDGAEEAAPDDDGEVEDRVGVGADEDGAGAGDAAARTHFI
jgi:hypothetical protein